jgi:hypothetical protein
MIGETGGGSSGSATRWALERKSLPNPGHQFRPRNSGCVVRTGFLIRVAAASRAVTVARTLTGTGLAPLANVPDRQRRDGSGPVGEHAPQSLA